jgi:hypothetical protein
VGNGFGGEGQVHQLHVEAKAGEETDAQATVTVGCAGALF